MKSSLLYFLIFFSSTFNIFTVYRLPILMILISYMNSFIEALLKLYIAYIELENYIFIDFSIKIILHFSSFILSFYKILQFFYNSILFLGSKSLLKPSHIFKKSESNVRVSNFQNKQDIMSKSFEQSKQLKLPYKNLSLELGHTEKTNATSYWVPQKSATINDLSRIQANNYDDDEKLYTKNIDQEDEYEHSSDVSEKVSNISCIKYKNINVKEPNLSSISYTMELNPNDLVETDIDVFNVSNIDGGSDGAVSEAGTYTIHKDYTDEEKARMDIDKVFSVGILTEDESNEACIHSFKVNIFYVFYYDNLYIIMIIVII